MAQSRGDEACVSDSFICKRFKSQGGYQIILDADFKLDDWQALFNWFHSICKECYLNLDLDLRRLQWINSMWLGCLIEFNKEVLMAKGSLRVIVDNGSHLHQILIQSQLNHILSLMIISEQRSNRSTDSQ